MTKMMVGQIATTPFGRRPVTFGQISQRMKLEQTRLGVQRAGSNRPEAVHKWMLFNALTEAKGHFGLSDRSLGVLHALLSFHQETVLSLPGEDENDEAASSCALVVFPSNKALCARAHGMAEQTLRRHLAALVDAGIILRRDSPNGKRYARRGAGRETAGEHRPAEAFGFDLSPLVLRAPEIETAAESERARVRRIAMLKERISLHRRDIGKLLELAMEQCGIEACEGFRLRYLAFSMKLRSLADAAEMEGIVERLARLQADLLVWLQAQMNSSGMSGNDACSERHKSESKHISTNDLEPDLQKSGAENPEASPDERMPERRGPETSAELPLGMVLEACPDIRDYGPISGIRTDADLMDAARVVRPMLGISPDAWQDAIEVLGPRGAAIVMAGILQRSEFSSEATGAKSLEKAGAAQVNGSPAIRSPGGYLRALTGKARAGAFSHGPLLMALIGQRLKARRSAAG